VSAARGKSVEQVDAIGQGRVWDGGTARQNGLVDQFGGLEEALAWVAAQAELEDGEWHGRFLGSPPATYDSLIRQLLVSSEVQQVERAGIFGLIAQERHSLVARLNADLDMLTGNRGVQAYCLECPIEAHSSPSHGEFSSVLSQLRAFLGR